MAEVVETVDGRIEPIPDVNSPHTGAEARRSRRAIACPPHRAGDWADPGAMWNGLAMVAGIKCRRESGQDRLPGGQPMARLV